jgi:hypothetical protein
LLGYTAKEVVSFTEEEEEIQEAYILAEEHLMITEDLLQEAKENNDGSDKGEAWAGSTPDKKNAAQSARAKGNDIYQKVLKKHSEVCGDLNIVRE